MLARASAPLGHARLIPDRRTRPTAWVIALMSFVTLVVAAAGLALSNAAQIVADGAEQRWSVQIPDGARQSAATAALLGRTPGVTAVRSVPEAELRATLERWLGPDLARRAGLPLPALIDLELAPGASPEPVRRALAAQSPGARLLSYGEQLGPLTRSLAALQWLCLGLVALMALATAATVVLATRGVFDSHKGTIDVLHGIGATDDQLATLFQRRVMEDALIGGFGGAAAAAGVLLLVLAAPGRLLTDLAGAAPLGWRDALLLTLIPLGATLLAALVARRTVLKALRAAL